MRINVSLACLAVAMSAVSGFAADGDYTHNYTCSCCIIEGSECRNVTTIETSSCSGTPCSNGACPPQTFQVLTFPDREINGFRPAFPGESGNNSFTGSSISCKQKQPCDSAKCAEEGTCWPKAGAGWADMVWGYSYTADTGSGCSVGGGY